MPRKPTQSFGYVAFSESGRVSKHMRELSGVKDVQEAEVAASFVEAFNDLQPTQQIGSLKQLSEADQDFTAELDGARLHLQVTEFIDWPYTSKMTNAEYDSGQWKVAVQKGPGVSPEKVDLARKEAALWGAVKNKLDKRYAKPAEGEFWLLVFTTDVLYEMEYFEGGTRRVSRALVEARRQLAAIGSSPFDQVWFTNLQTRPIRIWPIEQE